MRPLLTIFDHGLLNAQRPIVVMPYRILIADDHEIIRRGIMQRTQSKYPDALIHVAQSFEEVLEKIENNHYDVLVSDLKMENENPISGVMDVLKAHPSLKILVCSMYPPEYLAVRLLKMGVKGYIAKSASIEDILFAIDEVLKGNTYGDRALLSRLIGHVVDGDTDLLDRLSDRELEIFFMLINGNSLKEIGGLLHLHHSSVGTYKRRIFDKLEVENMVELTLFAVKHHLLL